MTDKDYINPAAQLQKWHVDLIQCFRKECTKLPEEKQKQILTKYDYSPPCQMEVFWLSRPNWQFTVTTHFEDRGDLEVTVNGPYGSNTFLDETEKILSQPRWNRPISKNSENLNPNHPSRYGEHIAQLLHVFVEAAKNAAFTDYDPTRVAFRRVNSENESIEFFYGDKRSFDYEKLVKNAITDIMNQSESGKKPRPIPKKQTEPPKHGKGFGAYFLPPIIIGNLPDLTISDRLHGTTSQHISVFDRTQFVKSFGKTPVIIRNDGFVGACTGDSGLAIRILNTVMATFEMKGLEARAVREHELSEIEYDPKTLNITSFGYDPKMTRNKPFDGYPNETAPERAVREINEEAVKNMIEEASKTFENPDMAQITVGFGDMLAHLKYSEFSQALVIGWTITEDYISQKWTDAVGSKPTDGQKDPKRLPFVGQMLKDLRPTMSDQDYNTFRTLKDLRNNHIHEGRPITRQQAQDMLDIVKNHVLKISH